MGWPHRVLIETLGVSRDPSGGTVEAWTTLADNVPCQITQGDGRKQRRFDQQPNVTGYTLSGNHAGFGRADTRLTVRRGPLPAGTLLRVTGFRGSWLKNGVPSWWRLQVEQLTPGS